MGQLFCGLCALCGLFLLNIPSYLIVSRCIIIHLSIVRFTSFILVSFHFVPLTSFAVTYKNKLWRNEIATKSANSI